MSLLTQAFITATDVEGNIAKIATSKIFLIEGLCTKSEYKEYLQEEQNRTKIHAAGYTWDTSETPEEIAEKIHNAQIASLKDLKKSRLPVPVTAELFNAFAAYKDEDEYNCFISIDNISHLDDEFDNTHIVTSFFKAKSVNTLDEIMKSIETAKQTRIKALKEYCLGVA